MKKGILGFLNVAIKSVLIVVLFFAAFTYLNKVFYNRDVYKGEFFHNLPENSIDAIVLGSSHAQYSFVPAVFYEDTGLYSYVLGSACQPLEVSVEMLKEALKTQSPKLVILEGYTSLPLHITSCLTDGCYVIAEYQMRGEEKFNTIKYLPEEKKESYYNDYYSYHNEWKILEDWSIFLPSVALRTNNSIDDDFGYIPAEPTYPISNFWTPIVQDVETGKLVEQDENSLNEILKICKENGIELFLYKTSVDSISTEDWATLKALWKWADDNGVKYLDILSNAEALGYYTQVHADGFHSYINGSTYITDLIAEQINELDIEFNHKEDETLEQLCRKKAQAYTADVIHYEHDPLKVLKRLENSNGYVMIRYIPSIYVPSTKMKNAIINVGFNDIDFSKSYYAIIHDGEILYSGISEYEGELVGEKVSINKDGMTIGDYPLTSKGLLTIGFLSENGINNAYIDIEYRESNWIVSGYNYEDLIIQ